MHFKNNINQVCNTKLNGNYTENIKTLAKKNKVPKEKNWDSNCNDEPKSR